MIPICVVRLKHRLLKIGEFVLSTRKLKLQDFAMVVIIYSDARRYYCWHRSVGSFKMLVNKAYSTVKRERKAATFLDVDFS